MIWASKTLANLMPVLWENTTRGDGSHVTKQTRYTAERVLSALRQAESRTPVPGILCKMGIGEEAFYRWVVRGRVVQVN